MTFLLNVWVFLLSPYPSSSQAFLIAAKGNLVQQTLPVSVLAPLPGRRELAGLQLGHAQCQGTQATSHTPVTHCCLVFQRAASHPGMEWGWLWAAHGQGELRGCRQWALPRDAAGKPQEELGWSWTMAGG